MTPTGARHLGLLVLLAAATACLPGCGYALEGSVVEGTASVVTLVPAGDARLSDTSGLAGATLEIVLDPGTATEASLGTVVTDARGRFSLPVSAMGAGLLEYQVAVFCRRPGFAPAEGIVPLPGSSHRLLVILTPGVDRPAGRGDIIQDTIREGKKFDLP